MWNTDQTVVNRYLDHYATPRGIVREELVDRQIREWVSKLGSGDGGKIVDIGGGDGRQSYRFAKRGFQVTLVDPSPLMLSRAAVRLHELDEETQRRVRLLQATADDASLQLPEGGFDAVLCHGVFMYVDDPAEMIDCMMMLVRPGGIVSILTKSSEALAARPALQGDFAAALDAFETVESQGWLGVQTRGDTVTELVAELRQRDAALLDWYGVGVFSDHQEALLNLPDDQLKLLVETETRAARTDPYRRMARLIHVLAQKGSGSDDSLAVG